MFDFTAAYRLPSMSMADRMRDLAPPGTLIPIELFSNENGTGTRTEIIEVLSSQVIGSGGTAKIFLVSVRREDRSVDQLAFKVFSSLNWERQEVRLL